MGDPDLDHDHEKQLPSRLTTIQKACTAAVFDQARWLSQGRKAQPALWKAWGGPPTTSRLRWRGGAPEAALRRLHERVEARPARRCPTPA